MALKRKISKADYEKLSDGLKEVYSEKDGSYFLDMEKDDDTAALIAAKEHEAAKTKAAKEEVAAAKAALKEMQDKVDAMEEASNKKNGNVDALEASYKKRLDTQKAEYEIKLANKDGYIKNALVDNVAQELAAKHFTNPKLILPHIKARLQADMDGDSPVTRVLDEHGKPSAMTIEDLTNSFVANPDFSAIVIASKANGGGAPHKQNGGGAPNFQTSQSTQNKSLTELSPAELVAHFDSTGAFNNR